MMSLAQPYWLLLLPILLVGWWWIRTRRESAIRYSSLDLIRGLPRKRAKIVTVFQTLLSALGLTSLIVAAAGPRRPDFRTPIVSEGVALAIVVDVSGSMGTPDFRTPSGKSVSRLDAAKQVFPMFLFGGEIAGEKFPGRAQDSVALIAFAAVPRTLCPLTLNHTVLVKALEVQSPKIGPDAGTNLGDAVAEAVIRLEASTNPRRAIIVLSDGEHNSVKAGDNGPLKPQQSAQLAKSLGIRIYSIDCGVEPGTSATPEEKQQRFEGRMVLQGLADVTEGRAFTANQLDELRTACQEIDQLERAPEVAFRYRRYRDDAPTWAIVGIITLALTRLLTLSRWQVQPR
jgi:Ca-activated chloride channel homolog